MRPHLKAALFRCSIHLLQQLQVGLLNTSTLGAASWQVRERGSEEQL
jgi:hypothetical protein